MTEITLYQVDAFADNIFEGNPAAVCPLDTWLDDDTLQKIAMENNLSETAFFVQRETVTELRWFTPSSEVDLCGHATLAAAHVMFKHLNISESKITFATRSGDLIVTRTEQGMTMNFPATQPSPIKDENIDDLLAGLGNVKPNAILKGFDYLVVLDNQAQLENLEPHFNEWLKLDLRGVVVTAPGNETDFVSRCFYPKLMVNEDPVTGSAHCQLTPYWASQLDRNHLVAKQLSKRTGTIQCELLNDRVLLTGNAVDYLQGTIRL